MKIHIITRHAPANYGSLLQSIATQKVINDMGIENDIIDYIPTEEKGSRVAFTQLKSKKEWNHNLVKRIAYILCREPINLLMFHKFKKMRKKYLRTTKTISNHQQLKKMFEDSEDVFLTGSDQVWGPVSTGTYDSAYFLQCIPEKCKKFAYAASFGKVEFTDDIMNDYKRMLYQYDKIAVREDSAVKILEKMNISTKQVLDPTLLLDKTEWMNILDISNDEKKDYVLVYQIHSNPQLDKYAIEFAKKANLPLIRVSAMLHQFKRGGKFVYLPDIKKFVTLINEAKFLVTDSFHGTAFAINLNTQFVEVLPNTGTSSRNQSILKMTDLEDRIVKQLDDYSFIDNVIDFSNVNRKIEQQRISSKVILNEMLNN